MHGVKLVHRFAASHHFKGPHDAYGKDAKHLCRTAERNKKARLASTFDVYHFCATMLPRPRRGVTAEQIVAPLPSQPDPPHLTEAEATEQRVAAAAALQAAPTREAEAALATRMQQAGLDVPPGTYADERGSEIRCTGPWRVD